MAPSTVYSFGPFELDVQERRLSRAGETVPLGERQAAVLVHLITNAGNVVFKESLISAVWGDVAVTDNSLEQAVSGLRRVLGDDAAGQPYVENVPRRGYRFAGPFTRAVLRRTDEALDELLAPHRAFIEGRAALETFEKSRIATARAAFAEAVATLPEQASAHLGLANACVMQFETTRADPSPDKAALALAVEHAREACRLDAESGEAWATLGFVLDRIGRNLDALAAARRAVMLDPGNWRHHFRLSLVSWGEERLGAAHKTRALLPGFPLAHFTAATVHVARQAFGEAERELAAGIACEDDARTGQTRFTSVALHWLMGLIALSQGDAARALAEFERELALEGSGHLYGRECAANTWYAIGALHWREGRAKAAAAACRKALDRVRTHPMAQVLAARTDRRHRSHQDLPAGAAPGDLARRPEMVMAQACERVLAGVPSEAVQFVEGLLRDAPAGSTGWLLPLEPVLAVHLNPDPWKPALARLRRRAA